MVGRALRGVALDDPYVTYRYADNLLRGLGPVYNPGEWVLSTTAFGYGMLLAAVAAVLPWLGLPTISNALSALGLGALALALERLCARHGQPGVGLAAGTLVLLSPLLGSTFGLETGLFLGLVGLGALAFDADRPARAALLLAAATVLRSDGALAFATLGSCYALAPGRRAVVDRPGVAIALDARPEGRVPAVLGAVSAAFRSGADRPWHARGHRPAVPLAIYLAVVLPYEGLLTALFGSPIPTTLAAKRAQATIGGWPDHWSGLRDLVAERLAFSPAYWLAVPLLALGLVAAARWRWALPLVLWAALQSVTYQALGVASYSWYDAPLVPAAALLVALGAAHLGSIAPRAALGRDRSCPVDGALGRDQSAPGDGALGRDRSAPGDEAHGRDRSAPGDEAHGRDRRGGGGLVTQALVLLLVAPLALAQLAGLRTLRASVPEPRALAYQRAGEWLDANLPRDARVAVMEVGIMGFYARRPMVDLLGLIRPETIDALRRQDFFWTIADTQPDAVVLTGKNPLWFQNAEPGHWLYQYYQPVARIDQAGFWGSPLTILRRIAPLRGAPELEASGPGRFGDAIALDRVAVERVRLRPGDFLTVQLVWRALAPVDRDYAAFVHVVTAEPRVVVQHDTPVASSRWPVGRAVQYYHPMRLPPDLPPGRYAVEVGLYTPEDPLRRLPPTDAPNSRGVARVADLTVEP